MYTKTLGSYQIATSQFLESSNRQEPHHLRSNRGFRQLSIHKIPPLRQERPIRVWIIFNCQHNVSLDPNGTLHRTDIHIKSLYARILRTNHYSSHSFVNSRNDIPFVLPPRKTFRSQLSFHNPFEYYFNNKTNSHCGHWWHTSHLRMDESLEVWKTILNRKILSLCLQISKYYHQCSNLAFGNGWCFRKQNPIPSQGQIIISNCKHLRISTDIPSRINHSPICHWRHL